MQYQYIINIRVAECVKVPPPIHLEVPLAYFLKGAIHVKTRVKFWVMLFVVLSVGYCKTKIITLLFAILFA